MSPGTRYSCIGADVSGKEEIDPQIFKDEIIYCDDLEHCTEVEKMEIPLKENIISKEFIHGEIGNLILGRNEGLMKIKSPYMMQQAWPYLI